ncbi:MAG: DPP IV N-terminal domain-containing protein [Bacteroidales bacterium]|nr:DPP IV N-terminal domain-containing protein [Bacteroidales bacterium]
MKKISFSVILTFVTILSLQLSSSLQAQNRMLDIKQTMDYSLYPRPKMSYVQFVGNTNLIAYASGDTIYSGKPSATKKLVTLNELNNALNAAGETSMRRISSFSMPAENELRFFSGNSCFLYNVQKRTLSKLYSNPDKGEHLDIEPNSFQQAYTIGSSLYVNSNGKVFCKEGKDLDIVYGQSVHRNEFGINKGTFWSPKGTYLAYYRMDQSMVTDYPLVNTSTRIASAEPFKYPMAGMKSHEVTVEIYNTVTEQVTYLKTRRNESVAERENYLTNLSWSPDESHLYIAKICRAQDHLWLESYNVDNGELEKILFEETNARYIDPQEGLFFLPGHNDQFLWFSERDGYKHLYLYNTDGKLLKQLTSGNYDVQSIISFDAKGENVFVYSNKDGATGLYAYKVNIKSGEMTLLTPDHGTHTVSVSNNGNTIIDINNSVDIPYRCKVYNAKGKALATVYETENPLSEYAMPGIQMGTIKAADGVTDLYYRLITPPNMKAGEKYPTLVYVYGGPHSQLVTDSWLGGGNLYFLFLAQQGYVVFTVDNRGTDNRGFEFESCTHRHLGEIEMADQMEGVKFLQSLPYVDKERMGVEGWSFGGFMTITMKLAHPEVFKVGCAGGPVIDWKWYEVMYGERYMDTPDENPEGYKNNSLIGKAGDLEGRLLVIHGAEDNTVVWQNSIEFIEACIKKGKLVDYFIYPHHEHNVRGYDRIHLYHKMFQYYEDFLKK